MPLVLTYVRTDAGMIRASIRIGRVGAGTARAARASVGIIRTIRTIGADVVGTARVSRTAWVDAGMARTTWVDAEMAGRVIGWEFSVGYGQIIYLHTPS